MPLHFWHLERQPKLHAVSPYQLKGIGVHWIQAKVELMAEVGVCQKFVKVCQKDVIAKVLGFLVLHLVFLTGHVHPEVSAMKHWEIENLEMPSTSGCEVVADKI